MDFDGWGKYVGEEPRKSFRRWLKDGFFQSYLGGKSILDIGYKGHIDEARPIVPDAIGVDLDYPGYDGKHLPFPDGSQDSVFASHTLEYIEDYRSAIAEWFRVLKAGGFLIIAVPHQFLFERKAQPPSLHNEDHKRFYTPASLLTEIEEALDPFSYRVRLLEDNDRNFDYSLPPNRAASGSYEIIMVIEKIDRPDWADLIFDNNLRNESEGIFTREPRFNPEVAEPLVIIRPDTAVRSLIILKLDHRGDFLVAQEAFSILRNSFQEAHISLVCGSWNVDSARETSFFDEIIPFDFFAENQSILPKAKDYLQGQKEFAALMGKKNFDLAIDLRVDRDTRMLLNLIEAHHKAGFGFPSEFPFLDIPLPFAHLMSVGRAERIIFPALQFSANFGKHLGHEISIPELRHVEPNKVLIYGPYAKMHPGKYSGHFLLESNENFEVGFDVACGGGSQVLGIGTIEVSRSTDAPFTVELDSPITDLEIRIRAVGGKIIPAFRFQGCALEKSGVHASVHQSESLAMLAVLVVQRMRNPFIAEEFRS